MYFLCFFAKFIFSVGFSIGLSENLFLILEMQPAYKGISDGLGGLVWRDFI